MADPSHVRSWSVVTPLWLAPPEHAHEPHSPYVEFTHSEWARLRAFTPLTLDIDELAKLTGLNEPVSLPEVADIYLPLSRLLNLSVVATQNLHRVTDTFLGTPPTRIPYVIGLAGSVAVGKSTAARVLRALLARWPDHPTVDLITTDGFLFPNAVLEERGLMARKGFPESYDLPRLLRVLAAVKAGDPEVSAPVYSHLTYDIVPNGRQVIRQPDILIVEGLNVLQKGPHEGGSVSDYFDFSIYIDAEERDIERWYVQRFHTLRDRVFTDPDSYFHRYATLSMAEAENRALRFWRDINQPNLRANIEPTRDRAHLVLEKGSDHRVERIRLRKW
jgi:type I pantothenate kinase